MGIPTIQKMIYITVTSLWAGCRIKSPAFRWFAQPFVQAQIKEHIKTQSHWPLWVDFKGDRWVPPTKGK